MSPAGRATQHHEGAGQPTDEPRGAGGGYTYWIGTTRWIRLRDVASSFATLHYNHVSLDVCLSGDRDVHPVTDLDLLLIHRAYDDAHQRGEITASPQVLPHRWSPGSSTVCPGNLAMLRWNQVARCYIAVGPTPPPPAPSHPTLWPGNTGQAVAQLQHELDVGAGYHLAQDGIYGAQTTLAVQAFQAFFRLGVDGIVGPRTWTLVDFCYAAHGGR